MHITGNWFLKSLVIHCLNPPKSRSAVCVNCTTWPVLKDRSPTAKNQHSLIVTVGCSLLQLQDTASPLHALFGGSLSPQTPQNATMHCNDSISQNPPHSGRRLLYRLAVQKWYILSRHYLTSIKLVRDTGCFDVVDSRSAGRRIEKQMNTFSLICSVHHSC